MKIRVSFTFLIILISGISFGQTGFIKGTIKDQTNSEVLYGVKILVEGQAKGAVTDFDGNFLIAINPGTYTLNMNSSGFNAKTINNVIVNAGDTTFVVETLEAIIKQIDQVTIKGAISKESNANLIHMQRNNASVVDGISAETIKKSPDSKASDVLKRVSGASVQDNKFVVVRGLNDRYNFALINGASLPSSESDRKAFSFDIFPSNMLDNLLITKTATPDLPGEFAGGVIDIRTTEPKEKNFQTVQVGGTYHSLTTFKNFRGYEGGNLDFLGYGSTSRELPSEIPATENFATLNKSEKADLAKSMNHSWGTTGRTALPGGSIQYSFGRMIPIKNKSLGIVFAYGYQNSLNTNNIIRRDFEEQVTGVVQKMELQDSVFNQTVMNSGMLNFTFKFNDKHKISFKNLYSVNSEDKVNVRKGIREMDNNPHQYEKSTNILYTQNNLLTSQLIGEHTLKTGKINWNFGYSDVKRDVPNMRRVVYRKYAMNENDTNERYVAVVQTNGTIPTAAGNMFWSNSNEKIASAKADYSVDLPIGNVKNTVKAGGMMQYRTRDFSSRNFGFSQYKPTGSNFNSELLLLPEEKIFAPENLGQLENGQGGFKLEESSKVDGSYQASSILSAGFLMTDTKFSEKFRLVGGARIESYNQNFNYIEFGSNLPKTIDSTVVDILPSANFIYSITKKMNVRIAYYKTVSRPEFRELAPFAFYNFLMDNILSGNPNLQRAVINNYDLRYEIFPGKSQMFSFSGFYKDFTNPIELINRTGTSGAPELYYTNISKVTNYGMELEYRVNLGFVSKEEAHPFWSGTTIYSNLSLIRSMVDLDSIVGSGGARPLQGQSPYIVNAGISYSSPNNSWSTSISYNVVGQRIYIVGNVQEPSVWENSRNVLDFQITKMLKEKWELKLNVKDILAQDLIFFQDLNNNRKFEKGIDNSWQEVTFGQSVSLSVKYSL